MISIILSFLLSASSSDIPENVRILMKHYPQIKSYQNGQLIFYDQTSLIYDDGQEKTHYELLENSDIEDMFHYDYPKGANAIPLKNFDPGRIRNESFFKKIYGSSKTEVKSHLTEIIWCPKLSGQKIQVTKVNGVSEKIKKISEELDELPEYKKYIQTIGGTFNWRYIKGTQRLSLHSFGMTIDMNSQFSDYWQWDSKSSNEKQNVKYRNRIPLKIVEIFEKYGFIWGGKWYHYDTMHFEYRPELLE